MTRSLFHARCLCGLRLANHYDDHNRKLTCAQAAELHRFAGIKFVPLRELLARSVLYEAGKEVQR